MFIGEYQHIIDDKGRLAIPLKFRERLGKGAVITRGFDSCLFVFPMDEWTKLAEKISALPFSQANSRAFSRLMLAGAMDVEIDKQGRVVVPEYLRTYSKLGKDTVVAGLYNRIEVWDRKIWEKYKAKTEKNSGEIAEKMGELGF
jgi:MraZ protein